jgi:hypothetical protein
MARNLNLRYTANLGAQVTATEPVSELSLKAVGKLTEELQGAS